jgi:hypothetical protein
MDWNNSLVPAHPWSLRDMRRGRKIGSWTLLWRRYTKVVTKTNRGRVNLLLVEDMMPEQGREGVLASARVSPSSCGKSMQPMIPCVLNGVVSLVNVEWKATNLPRCCLPFENPCQSFKYFVRKEDELTMLEKRPYVAH